jgi:hypothetical protein
VDHFTGLLLVTATTDEEAAGAAARALPQESPDSPAGALLARLTALAPTAAHLLGGAPEALRGQQP